MSYRVRYTMKTGETGLWLNKFPNEASAKSACAGASAITGYTYSVEPEQAMGTAAVPDATPNPTASQWPGWTASTPHPATPEARIRELEAEIGPLRDAYDAARQDLDVAMRKVARLESNLAMVQASWAASVASADVARAASAEAHRKAVVSVVRLDRALALGDAMHRAHPSEDWAEYKNTLAASRQGPAKASEEPGEGAK